MGIAKRVILLGRSLRGEAKIGLRQPLQKIRIAGVKEADRAQFDEVSALIKREVNIKEIDHVSQAKDIVIEEARPNFRSVGKKVGKEMKALQFLLSNWSSDQIQEFEAKGVFDFRGVELTKEDIEIHRKAIEGRLAMSDKDLVVELDVQMTEALVDEGLRREVVNRIQQRRNRRSKD